MDEQHTKLRNIRIISLLATLILMIGFLRFPVYASENNEDRTGLRHSEALQADSLVASQIYQKKTSASYSSPWEKYSTCYYYNQMNSNEKKLYDGLNTMCLAYMTGGEDFEDYIDQNLTTKYVYADGLSLQEALNVARIFYYSNPQYYFLKWYSGYRTVTLGYGNEIYYICMVVYDEFKSANVRKTTTNELASKIQEYYNEIDDQWSEFEKEKALHDLLIYNVTYVNGYYSQSIYSTFFQQETVCAGYAHAFELLCNGLGIDCVTVTSSGHAWNKARINDVWYEVDCTWDDTEDVLGYLFFNRSNSVLKSIDDQNDHIEENLWVGYGPLCMLDSGGSYSTCGDVTEPANQTGSPKVNLTYYDGSTLVALSSDTTNAVLYYTINGKTPSEAFSKSLRYSQPFTMKASQKLQVIAVYNTFKDSKVVVQNVPIRYYKAATPVIVTQPKSTTYTYGNTPAALKVAISPVGMVNVTYQWYVKSSATGSASPITGATKSYYLPPANKAGTRYYFCIVTNRDENAYAIKTSSKASATAKIVINPVAVSTCKISGIANKTYTGKAITQSPKLIYKGKTLIKNTDYILSYSANKAIGKAKCIITGKGNYKGQKTYYFKINPPKTSITSAKKGSKKVTLSWKKKTMVKGYQIQYSYHKDFSSATKVTKKGYKITSDTLKKLKSKKNCYFRIRTYKTVSGVNYYSSWSGALKIKIK